MAFTPTDPSSLPTPDEVLAQLQPEPSDPNQVEGYITPDDIAFAWQVFLSRLAHHDDALTALRTASQALTGRVTATEQASQTLTNRVTALEQAPVVTPEPFARTVAVESALPAVDAAGTLLLALDTGQWFVSDGSAWQRLGLDAASTAQDLASALSRTDRIDEVLAGMVGDTAIDTWTAGKQFQIGDVVLHNGALYVGTAPSQGATPGAAADKWSLLSLPDLLAKVKQALAAQGASGVLPVPENPADDGKVLTARGGAGVWEVLAALTAEKVLGGAERTWAAGTAYAEHDVVLHNGHYWIARAAASAGEEPGVDGKWRPLTLPELWLSSRPGALDSLSDVTAPADTPAGKVLGTTAEGAWGAIDPPAGGTPFDLSAVPVYSATTEYKPGTAVLGAVDGKPYIALRLNTGSAPEGNASRWAPLDGLVAHSDARTALADAMMIMGATSWTGLEWWSPSRSYSAGALVKCSYDSSMMGIYRANEATTAGTDIPGVSTKWRSITLKSLATMRLKDLADVSAEWGESLPGKVLGVTTQGEWGPVDLASDIPIRSAVPVVNAQGKVYFTVANPGTEPFLLFFGSEWRSDSKEPVSWSTLPGDTQVLYGYAFGSPVLINGAPLTVSMLGTASGPVPFETYLATVAGNVLSFALPHVAPTGMSLSARDVMDRLSALTLGDLRGVTAPANTPAGKVLGTTAEGAWGPVDAPQAGGTDGTTEPPVEMPVEAGKIRRWRGDSADQGKWGLFTDPQGLAAAIDDAEVVKDDWDSPLYWLKDGRAVLWSEMKALITSGQARYVVDGSQMNPEALLLTSIEAPPVLATGDALERRLRQVQIGEAIDPAVKAEMQQDGRVSLSIGAAGAPAGRHVRLFFAPTPWSVTDSSNQASSRVKRGGSNTTLLWVKPDGSPIAVTYLKNSIRSVQTESFSRSTKFFQAWFTETTFVVDIDNPAPMWTSYGVGTFGNLSETANEAEALARAAVQADEDATGKWKIAGAVIPSTGAMSLLQSDGTLATSASHTVAKIAFHPVDENGQSYKNLLMALRVGDLVSVQAVSGFSQASDYRFTITAVDRPGSTQDEVVTLSLSVPDIYTLPQRQVCPLPGMGVSRTVSFSLQKGGASDLDGLTDVTAPADTPAGKVLGTTAEGVWEAVDVPSPVKAYDEKTGRPQPGDVPEGTIATDPATGVVWARLRGNNQGWPGSWVSPQRGAGVWGSAGIKIDDARAARGDLSEQIGWGTSGSGTTWNTAEVLYINRYDRAHVDHSSLISGLRVGDTLLLRSGQTELRFKVTAPAVALTMTTTEPYKAMYKVPVSSLMTAPPAPAPSEFSILVVPPGGGVRTVTLFIPTGPDRAPDSEIGDNRWLWDTDTPTPPPGFKYEKAGSYVHALTVNGPGLVFVQGQIIVRGLTMTPPQTIGYGTPESAHVVRVVTGNRWVKVPVIVGTGTETPYIIPVSWVGVSDGIGSGFTGVQVTVKHPYHAVENSILTITYMPM